MVPETAKKPIPRKCPICDKKLVSKEALVNHIDRVHNNQIPDDWSAARYENYLRTGMKHGNCTECGKPTTWNDATWKYNRHCGSAKCIKSISKRADNHMIAKYGVVHKLNDPEMQRKMIYSKRTSGAYYFSNDDNKKYKIMYASSQEKNFLEMLDVFLNMDPSDIMGPSPHTYTYKYEGKDHFYIPDFYISSLNLEIEIKEPLDNQNNHPKIQSVDKVKEDIKDELMKSVKEINYIKINGTDYSKFFAFISSLKEMDDVSNDKPVIRGIIESEDVVTVTESNADLMDIVDRYNDLFKVTMDIKRPSLDFKTTVSILKKHIQTCKKKDIPYVENELMKVENELHEISIKKPQDAGSENVYEAKKALKIIREQLKPMLEAKKKALVESTIYMEDSDMDYSMGFMESREILAHKNGKIYRPVFVVLTSNYSPAGIAIKAITGQPYSHACLSLDTTMKNLATFNLHIKDGKRGGGFIPSESFEFGGYTDKRSTYAIYMYLASQPEFMTIDQIIDQFKQNADNFKYSFRGCLNYLFNRQNKNYSGEYFCSEFVADVLKQANPKLLDRESHLYSPGDLANTKKLRFVISGRCVDYDEHKTDLKVSRILKDRGMQGVEIKN